MCCGEVDAKDFTDAGANTLYVDVDTSKCKFEGQPFYFAQMYADGSQYSVYTVADIVNPDRTPNEMSPKKFRVYLRNAQNDGTLTAGFSKANHDSLKWCGFGSRTSTKPVPSYAMCCGSSRSKAWTSNSGLASLDVNTAGCGWKDNQDKSRMALPPPWYFTAMKDTSNGKSASVRATAVYSPGMTGFRTYLMAQQGEDAMTTAVANDNNLNVEWCGVRELAGATNGKAGYPCSSPRVIVGNGDQSVQTNHAKICCEKTSSSGFKAGGRSGTFLEKTIDISPCNMKKVHVTLVDIRGDEGSVDHVGGAAAFSVGTNADHMKVKVWTKGKYKFYDAERYNWHVQYCLIGI